MFKTMEDLAAEAIKKLEDEKVETNIFDPYMHMFDMDNATKIMMKDFPTGTEAKVQLELVSAHNDTVNSDNHTEDFMKQFIDIVNKYNLNLDEQNVSELLSRFFITKEGFMSAMKIWRGNKPIFEKTIHFVVKNGKCANRIYQDKMKNDISNKGKNNVKYVVGDDECLSCTYFNEAHSYCNLYNLKRVGNILDLLKEKEFKK